MSEFAKELADYRAKHGLTQGETADIIGMSIRTYWGWEAGGNVSPMKQNGVWVALEKWAKKNPKKKTCRHAKTA